MEKPKIKSLKVYKSERDETEKDLILHRELNERGNRVKEITFSLDGEPVEEKEFTYNETGKLLQEKSHYAEDEVTEVLRFEYDVNGRITKTHKSYGEEGDEDCTYYLYNTSGKIIEKRTESNEGEVEHKEVWMYEGDKLIENVVTDYDGKIIERCRFSYDEQGDVKEELRYTSETEQELKILYDHHFDGKTPDTTVYNKAGNIVQRSRHTFDEKKRLITEITETVNAGVKKFTSTFSYDDQDNLLETRLVDKNENLISKIVYKHNTFNLVTEEVHYEEPSPGLELKQSSTFTEYEFY